MVFTNWFVSKKSCGAKKIDHDVCISSSGFSFSKDLVLKHFSSMFCLFGYDANENKMYFKQSANNCKKSVKLANNKKGHSQRIHLGGKRLKDYIGLKMNIEKGKSVKLQSYFDDENKYLVVDMSPVISNNS